ncbi:MAG: hypothetical protein FWG20_00970, partial [Candidatus Cloacimonetes bacterium]|nr:hypothetical protein [Candidatus Cloacimonadota bacterium]
MKRKIFHITIFIILALVCASVSAQAPKTKDSDPILVEIKGYDIMTSDLLKKIENLPTLNQSRFKSVEGQHQILDMMVTEQVFLKNADELGIKQLEEVKEAIHLALRPVANEIHYAELLDKEPAVTAAEIKKNYNDNIQNFTIPPKITIQHLQIDSEELSVISEMAKSEHADFVAMIREHSKNPQTAASLGLIRNIRLNGNIVGIGNDPKLEGYIDKATVSEEVIHGPFTTETGIHFFKKIEHEPAIVRPFEDVALDIESRLTSAKDQEFYAKYMDSQYKKYAVVTHKDLIPENIYEVSSSEMQVVITEGKHPDIRFTLGEYLAALRSAMQEREDIDQPHVRERILKREVDSRVMYAAAQDAKVLERKKDDYQMQQTTIST